MSTRNKQTKAQQQHAEVTKDSLEGDKKMVYYTSIDHQPHGGDSRHQINETQLYNISSSNMTIDSKITNENGKMITTLTNVNRSPNQSNGSAVLISTTTASVTPNANGNAAAAATTPTSSTNKQHKCELCNMFFGSKSAHTSHMKSHAKTANGTKNGTTSGDPYQCDVCKKTFAVPARLVRHYRTHTGERPFECEFCHKMFSVKENLQVHRRIHTKERPYKCDRCGRAFEHSGKLHRHMRIHTGERPHKCSVCSKTFIQSGQLVIHMRTHTGEKPYKCQVEGCGKGFTCSKQLKVHSRTHTGEKPYHCDICFRDFGYNHVLKLHRVQHYGAKCYECTICRKTFKTKKEMEAHIKGHANEMPDDEPETSTEAIARPTEPQPIKMDANNTQLTESPTRASPTSTMPMSPPNSNASSIGSVQSQSMPTPQSMSSETEVEDMAYYNMFTRFDHAASDADYKTEYKMQSHGGGVNPALLAAVSFATANENADLTILRTHLPTTSASAASSATNALLAAVSEQDASMDPSFLLGPLSMMSQRGYLTPAPQVSQYKSSMHASSEIVKCVEAALAGAEPMLTPPRSTPESPDHDRSSSPDSDIVVTDRDVMSLPLRKRKNYPRDRPHADNVQTMSDEPQPQIMRMSSVIQFAKAS